MNCMHCGTPLPSGAIFCGECGRRASGPAQAQAPTAPPSREAVDTPPPPAPELDGPPSRGHGWSLSHSDAADAASRALADEVTPGSASGPAPERPPVGQAAQHAVAETVPESQARSAAEAALAGVVRNPLACDQCGTAMGPGDIFCGECGSVSRSVTAAFTRSVPVQPAPEGVEVPELTGERPARGRQDGPEAGSSRVQAPPLPTMPIFVQSPPGAAPVAVPPPREAASLPPVPAPAAPPVAPPAPSRAPAAPPSASRSPKRAAAADTDHDDVEATRIVARRGGERFVLQFSTGESVTVYGSGLIGRNPRPEPGEYFDQLVRVLDSGRSVSKTHLEFGQDAGVFWIKDRFSGNGTVLKEPDAPPRRLEPDRRCRVLRGSRVEVGEQFFVVS